VSREVILTTPLKSEDVVSLRVRDVVYINGVVYTARDLAHIRIAEYLKEGKPLPVDLRGAVIYHAGPATRRRNDEWEMIVIGPTTSMRMEPFSELLLGRLGVKAIVGKGGMGEGTQEALKKYVGVYLLAPPGCGVLQAKFVKRILAVHWLDLGMPEAIWVLEVSNWGPLVVAMDSHGGNLFKDVKEGAVRKMHEILKSWVVLQ
jgi:fumarate hydratase subunit beta